MLYFLSDPGAMPGCNLCERIAIATDDGNLLAATKGLWARWKIKKGGCKPAAALHFMGAECMRSIAKMDTIGTKKSNQSYGKTGCQQRRYYGYFTCLLTSLVRSNMDTWSLPSNNGLSLASALIIRLLAGSCRLCALM
ncbi:hypothetical protein GA0116948_110167 [Chitinophaga costaii]|uniref:Uncharacterized protein n=1 Tax=Chitinophaga costaii TaxID=1335309 RepID=A0A1C4EZH5_9BACT|nr:hypothetical protein GA0116948_110167 [Chitinophaga costaii]